MRRFLVVAVLFGGAVFSVGRTEATEIPGGGGSFQQVFNTDSKTYTATATPASGYKFVNPQVGSGWMKDSLGEKEAKAHKTFNDPLKSAGFFGKALYGRITPITGEGPGTPPKWEIVGDRINIHSGDEYIRKIMAWKGEATFSASGGDTDTIKWKLSGDSELMTGTGATFKIAESDFGDDGKIKKPGEYTLAAKDKHGAKDSMKVVVVKVVLANQVWWNGYLSNGTTKIDLNNYSVDSKLTAKGISSGTFTWKITSGSNRLELAKDNGGATFSSSVTETNDNSIYLYAKAGSRKKNDITIGLHIDDQKVTNFKMTVYRPKYAYMYKVDHTIWDIGSPPLINYGYKSIFHYVLGDQFKNPIPHYPLFEYFPGKWINDKPNSWPVPPANSFETGDDAKFVDRIGVTSPYPDTKHPQSPLEKTLIRHRIQEIRSGTKTPAKNAGLLLRTNTIRQYLDHGSIVTKGKEYQ